MTDRRAFLQASAAAFAVPMLNRRRFRLFVGSDHEYSARCIDLMRRALVVDMLFPLALSSTARTRWLANPATLPASEKARFLASGVNVCHMAVGWGGPDAYLEALRYFMGHNALVAEHADTFVRIDSAADLASVKASGKVGVLLGAQNSDHFLRPNMDLKDPFALVDEFYGYGQRVSQLTYNTMNWFGCGSTERTACGLSDFGVALVERMNKVGMAVDTAHCGDRTTLDAFEVSKQPVLVTHSNVRALANGHPRCKPDEVIRAVGKAGSVFGVTGVRMFVKATEPTTIEDFLNHIDYVAKMIGVEHVGIGSDVSLDGYDAMPADEAKALRGSYKGSYGFRDKIDIDGIDHPQRMFDVTEGLIRRRYTDDQILGVLGGNFQRVLGQIWV